MGDRKLVVIGASAGGVDAMMSLARMLPEDFGAPVLIVIHIPAESPSLLPEILTRVGTLRAKAGEDGERARDGVIYIAPPDHHMLIHGDFTLKVVRGPRENRHRPAIDPLFRSAALAAGPNVVAVILSGSLDDGTAGMVAVKNRGGIAIVQDPTDAIYPSMPASVIEHADVDYILPLAEIADQMVRLVGLPAREPKAIGDARLMETEKRIAEMDAMTMQNDDRPGHPSAFSCPDCGGVLWEIEDGELTRYRCRVGHAFSHDTMLGAQDDKLEEALWSALKTLEESARLSSRLAKNERFRGHDWMAKRFEDRERDARDRAEVIRRFLKTQRTEVPIDAQSTHR